MPVGRRSNFSFLLLLLIPAIMMSGCASSRTQSFAMSFLPSVPAPEQDTSLAEPPVIQPSFYSRETPSVLEKSIAVIPAPSDAEARIRRAEQRFEAGKQLYQQGDLDAARGEFDRAVDVLMAASLDLPDRPRLDSKLDQLLDSIYRFDAERLGAGEVHDGVVYDKAPLDEILKMTFPTDPNLKGKVKEE